MKKEFLFLEGSLHLKFLLLDDHSIRLISIGKEKKEIKDSFEIYRPAEIQLTGLDQNGHHGIKNIDTYFGMNAKFVSFEKKDQKDFLEVILLTKDEYLECKTHYLLYKDCDVIAIYNEVKNISKERVRIEFVSSYLEYGLGKRGRRDPYEKLYFHTPFNSWHVEAEWKRESFKNLGLYNGNNNLSFKKIELNNTGSWSSKEYLPMCCIEDEELSSFELLEIEHNGSWHIEVGDENDILYLNASGPTHNNNDFTYSLKPNETFIGVKASCAYGDSFEKVVQEMTKYRRLVRLDNKDYAELPLIYNDYMHALWDKQTEALVLPLVNIAKEAGSELFVIDAGWFAKGSDWWNILGDWREEPENWPHGLKKVIDYIHSKGLKAGLWIEIEAMGKDCPTLKDFSDDCFFTFDKKKTINHSRYQLDFANEKVYEYALKTIQKLVERYDLNYLKIDYNTDAGVGSDKYSSSLGEGLYRHNLAYLKWLREIHTLFPDLTIENCASGGNRMDYATLAICPIQSTSDQTDYRKYPYLSGSVLTAVTPEQAAVWSYPVDTLHKDFVLTDESVTLNMVNAMLGRIHLASDLSKLSKKQFELVKEGVVFYKQNRAWKTQSLPIYPLGISSWGDPYIVAGLIDEDHILLNVTNLGNDTLDLDIDLSPYGVQDIEIGYPKKSQDVFSFKNDVLHVHLDGPYIGRLFLGRRKKNG